MASIERAAAQEVEADNMGRAVADKAERILRRREVLARVGIGQSTLYDWMKRGEFPRPVALGSKLVGWRESDVDAWMAAREVKAA